MGSQQDRRDWRGPALLSFGFRPFFLFGALWSAVAMALWIAMLTGWVVLPSRFSPVDWHAHEMLFGYVPAAIAGFLLTAVPNWTGRLPILGWPLAALFLLWLAGRVIVAFGAAMPAVVVLAVDGAFLAALALAIAREIVAGKNWRNLKVLVLVSALAIANLLYHLEALGGEVAASGLGARMATAIAVMLIIIVGGRIVPSFTRNWLAKRQSGQILLGLRPPRDGAAIVVAALALVAWVVVPNAWITATMCALAGCAHGIRLASWRGWRTSNEALVWILHVGYGFVPLGFLLLAAAWALPDALAARAAQHAFMAGAIAVMTLAVMTRASLGHTGRALHATPAITAIYALAILAACARVASGISGAPAWLLNVAAGLWIAAFLGFAVVYAPILALPRRV